MQYFDQIYDVMVRSGQLVMHHFRQDIDIDVVVKSDGSVVTHVDIENELFLQAELARIVPCAGFIAEESGLKNEQFDFMWIVDPLDGTRNFIKGIPHFCICVALTYKGKPIVAAIYNPVTHDFYYAESGHGAWLNKTKKMIVQDHDFNNRGIVVVIDENRLKDMKFQQDGDDRGEPLHISNRYFGSAGLDTAYLAAGYVDLLVFESIAWWDVAAGMLLIEQAGGFVDWSKNSTDIMAKGTFKAGHPSIYQRFLTIIDKQNL